MRSFMKSHRRNSSASEKEPYPLIQSSPVVQQQRPKFSSANSTPTSPTSPSKKSRNPIKNFLKQKVSSTNLVASAYGSVSSPKLKPRSSFSNLSSRPSPSLAPSQDFLSDSKDSSSPTIYGTKTHNWSSNDGPRSLLYNQESLTLSKTSILSEDSNDNILDSSIRPIYLNPSENPKQHDHSLNSLSTLSKLNMESADDFSIVVIKKQHSPKNNRVAYEQTTSNNYNSGANQVTRSVIGKGKNKTDSDNYSADADINDDSNDIETDDVNASVSSDSSSSRFSFQATGRNASFKYYKSNDQLKYEEMRLMLKENHDKFKEFVNDQDELNDLEEDMNYIDFHEEDETDDLFNRKLFSSDEEDEGHINEVNDKKIPNNDNDYDVSDVDIDDDYLDEANAGDINDDEDYPGEIKREYLDEVNAVVVNDALDEVNGIDDEDKEDDYNEDAFIKPPNFEEPEFVDFSDELEEYEEDDINTASIGATTEYKVPEQTNFDESPIKRDSSFDDVLLKPNGEYDFSISDQDTTNEEISPGLLPQDPTDVEEIDNWNVITGNDHTGPAFDPEVPNSVSSEIHLLLSKLTATNLDDSRTSTFDSNITLKEVPGFASPVSPSNTIDNTTTAATTSGSGSNAIQETLAKLTALSSFNSIMFTPAPSPTLQSSSGIPATASKQHQQLPKLSTHPFRPFQRPAAIKIQHLSTNSKENDLQFLENRYSWFPNDEVKKTNSTVPLSSQLQPVEETATTINKEVEIKCTKQNNYDDFDDYSHYEQQNDKDDYDYDSMLDEINRIPEDFDFENIQSSSSTNNQLLSDPSANRRHRRKMLKSNFRYSHSHPLPTLMTLPSGPSNPKNASTNTVGGNTPSSLIRTNSGNRIEKDDRTITLFKPISRNNSLSRAEYEYTANKLGPRDVYQRANLDVSGSEEQLTSISKSEVNEFDNSFEHAVDSYYIEDTVDNHSNQGSLYNSSYSSINNTNNNHDGGKSNRLSMTDTDNILDEDDLELLTPLNSRDLPYIKQQHNSPLTTISEVSYDSTLAKSPNIS